MDVLIAYLSAAMFILGIGMFFIGGIGPGLALLILAFLAACWSDGYYRR